MVDQVKIGVISGLLLVTSLWVFYWVWWGLTANDIIENAEWFGKLNWYPGTFTNTSYVTHMSTFMGGVVFSSVVAVGFFVGQKYIISGIAIVAPVIILSTGLGAGVHAITSLKGLESGMAKVECWLPESAECHRGKGLSVPNSAPKVWVDGELSEWASKELRHRYEDINGLDMIAVTFRLF